jgi:hypothetical protein
MGVQNLKKINPARYTANSFPWSELSVTHALRPVAMLNAEYL